MRDLIEQYKCGELSREDLEKGVRAYWSNLQEPDEQYRDFEGEEMWASIMNQGRTTKVRRMNWIRYAAAAVLILIAGATYFILTPKEEQKITASVFKNDVAPGKPGAKLILSDTTLELDQLKDGLIAKDGGYEIYKENGQIIYKGNGNAQSDMIYNTLVADKKQMSSAKLPDGTIAWVNAESSVKYPVRFTGSERKVIQTGQAIFDVVHNNKQPFRTQIGDKVFEDLGTVFDVNAYNPNEITTTVLEGLVKTGNTEIHKGEQAKVDAQGNVKLIKNADVETAFAWRDGQFMFSNASIEEVMKQAERWYDVEVVYEGKTDVKFIFSADRNQPISMLLQKMEKVSGVHFEIEGRKVMVKP